MRSLALDASKAGDVTIRDLVALAELQGCELRIQFEKRPEQLAKEQTAARTAVKVGAALKEE